MKRRNSYIGYYFFSRLAIPFYYLFFGGKIIGKENIPKKGKCILAGKHMGYFDAFLLCSSTHRPLHFIAKKELFSNFITRWFFNIMHLIPVDRKNKNPKAYQEVKKILNDNRIICIFPEGTFNKEGNDMLPFKTGTVKFALENDCEIVPFAISGKYKIWSRPKLIIGRPFKVTDMDIESANKLLFNKVNNLLQLTSEPLYFKVLKYVKNEGKTSASFIQRKFNISHEHATRIMKLLENQEIIEIRNDNKPRKVSK